ncbi:MAG: hypothetical protein RL172_2233 [Bacteroidota bacterium]|jgi:hydroxymethylbilane synthase
MAMHKVIRIGTRESQLAVWQAKQVQQLLALHHYASELVYIKSEGDIDLQTPLYQMGVQGIFTRSLDIALLKNNIDIAVHSMKDVPTQLAAGITQAAVLPRASYKDLLVFNPQAFTAPELHDTVPTAALFDNIFANSSAKFTIATSSIRRKAQWLSRYPHHQLDNLRGNVNTRLRKVAESNWHGAIFAAAGLERIGLRPASSVELDWMLPAPAQGAIMVVCRTADDFCLQACSNFNDEATATCTRAERDFLRSLLGGCTTPISALATIQNDTIFFKGNLLSVDGTQCLQTTAEASINDAHTIGNRCAQTLLNNGAQKIIDGISAAK